MPPCRRFRIGGLKREANAMNAKSNSFWLRNMLSFLVGAAAVSASLAVRPAAAQQVVGGAIPALHGTTMVAPGLQLHAVNPSLSLTAPATAPIQEQMQDDYATGLMSAQRQLLEQNPSGTTREELSIERQLDGYTGPR
jgi:hypothetical protein